MSYQNSSSGWTPPQSPPVDSPGQAGTDNQGMSLNAVEAQDAQSKKRREGDKGRRRRFLVWVLAAVIAIIVVVLLMIWLWSTELFVAAELADTAADLAATAANAGGGR